MPVPGQTYAILMSLSYAHFYAHCWRQKLCINSKQVAFKYTAIYASMYIKIYQFTYVLSAQKNHLIQTFEDPKHMF